MHAIPQLVVSTILLGGIYALIAVGLTLIFGVMRVVNFAHGEFLMLGMYLAFWAFTLLRARPLRDARAVAARSSSAVGWLSYRIVMRPVIHASHNVQVFTTVGLSIALQNVALVLWTADSQFVRTSYYAVVVRLGERGAQPRPARRLRRRRALHRRALRLHALVVHGQGHAGDRPGPARRVAHGHRHRPRLRAHLGGRHRLRRRGRRAARADLPRLSDGRAPVRADRLRRRRAGRARRHGGRADRQPRSSPPSRSSAPT